MSTRDVDRQKRSEETGSNVNLFLSPDQDPDPDQNQNQTEISNTRLTPTRVMSSHSLAGENFVLSHRSSLEFPTDDILLSPFTPSVGTPSPPSTLVDPMTPPAINGSISSSVAGHGRFQLQQEQEQEEKSQKIQQQQLAPGTTTSSSLPGRMRPPRVPHISLQPSRNGNGRHGRGLSNSEFSFVSALSDGTNNENQSLGGISIPRRRTASWDINEIASTPHGHRATDSPGGRTSLTTQSTPLNLLQPILSEDFDAPPASIVTSSQTNTARLHKEMQMPSDQNILLQEDHLSSRNITMSSSSKAQTKKSQALFNSQNAISSDTNRSISQADSSNVRQVRPRWNPSWQQNTGSFTLRSNKSRDESNSEGRSSSRKRDSKNRPDKDEKDRTHSIYEVIDAYPKEAPEETLLLSKLDASKVTVDPERIFPDVSSEVVGSIASENPNKDGGESHQSESATPQMATERLDFLAKKLRERAPKECEKTNPDGHKMGHHRQETMAMPLRDAGDKMYEAAETLFGKDMGDTNGTKDEELGEAAAQDHMTESEVRLQQKRNRFRRLFAFQSKANRDMLYFFEFLGPKGPSIKQEFTRLLRWIMLPCLGIAVVLYYFANNPGTGYDEESDDKISNVHSSASISWWLIFVGVRQVITLELARFSQLILIDFFTLRTRTFPRFIGPSLSLLLAQAKGWPFILILWAFWDFALLYGNSAFAKHWLYWQSIFEIFSETNPSGSVTSSGIYRSILICDIVVGLAASIKRYIMGQLIGTRVVRNYREELEELLKSLVVMSETSHYAFSLHDQKNRTDTMRWQDHSRKSPNDLSLLLESNVRSTRVDDSFEYSDVQSVHTKVRNQLSDSEKVEIMDLLEEWEEPELQASTDEVIISIGDILQFRRALEFVNNDFPFSVAFGPVKTRQDCIASSQRLFDCLMDGKVGPFLSFDALCVVAKDSNGNIDKRSIKHLIHLFRPNRNGQLSKLDFVKSVDSIYKRLRLLLASIKNSQQIDHAYEALVNVAFFVITSFIAMAIIGINIESLLIVLGSTIVSFAFLIGPASSKALEGVLFVLVRKPFDIGDRVSIDQVDSPCDNFGGESSWIVEKVNLYSTTARLGTTRELATFSNGSLASMRIMNLNRSDKPNVYLHLKFSVDSTLHQRQTFKRRIIEFVKERPRQWIRVIDFRCVRVEADLGYVEYVLVIQNREKWQHVNAILTSRGEVFNYAVELQKELNMRYKAPHVPVDIRRIASEDGEDSHYKHE